MNREQEALLEKFKREDKLRPDFLFSVLNKNTGVQTLIPGSVISGFLDEKSYKIAEYYPSEPQALSLPVVEEPGLDTRQPKAKTKKEE